MAWLWGIIILSIEKVIYYELNKPNYWYLTLIMWASVAAFLVLVWPHRFMISEGKLYFPSFPKLRMNEFDLRHIDAVRSNRVGCSFSYAGKRYYFLTLGKSKIAFESIMKQDQKNALHS
ncbi:EbsA family protein [Lactococcus fujiensis]|uniref:EbsA family protein n=1 Tax=Lactococcus fujiensis TaxID=610251 RepID=UPI0006D048A9|nr:EbsA family protein [Lactococcus fujiensis]